MSPLICAAFLAEAATLPLPHSQEMSDPACGNIAPLLKIKNRLNDANKILGRLAARECS